MPYGWGGADPTVAVPDSDDYELGTEYLANQDIRITKLRIWADPTEEGYSGRTGGVWTTGGVRQATVSLPATLPSGWSSYPLSTPLVKNAGDRFIVSYTTGGNYGYVNNALAASVNSLDSAVTAIASGSATNGNGVFNLTPGSFPASTNNQRFYGADFEYKTAPANDEEWLDDIFDCVVSDIQASGYFDRVNEHEAMRAPGYGLTAAVWVNRIFPVPRIGGLTHTSACVLFTCRIYIPIKREQSPDMIDRNGLKALSNIMRRYHDDFDFGGAIRNVDLLGISGISLAGEAGYIELDGAMYRAYDLQIPCLVNDVWQQTA